MATSQTQKSKENDSATIKDLRQCAAEYNPRTITGKDLDRLRKALEEFGDLGGIVKNIRTGAIVSGHQRIKVIPANAVVEKTEIFAEPTRTGTVAQGYVVIEGERFSYREVDWCIEKERAANVAANAHGGDWDEEKLADLLRDIMSAEVQFDLDTIGFDLAEVHQLLGEDVLTVSPADKLVEMADKLREARECFKEVCKKLEEVDDVLDSYLVVVFRDAKQRTAFTATLELEDNRYIDGRTLQGLLQNRNNQD